MDESAKALMNKALAAAMADPELLETATTAGVNLAPMEETDFSAWVEQQNAAIGAIYDMLD